MASRHGFAVWPKRATVEQVGFGSVGNGGLRRRDLGRDEVGLDGIGVDAVVELGQSAVEIPGEGEATVLIVLEALEFLDEVEFELRRNPGSEFKGNIPVGVSAAITA